MLDVNVQLQRPPFALDVAFRQTRRIMGVFGPSGAGKTTLMHLIAGLESPDHGRVALDDELLTDTARRVNVPAHRRRIGMVFQDGRLLPHYSVRGNLCYGLCLARQAGMQPGFDAVVSMLELGGLLSRRVRNLSGGERQRVALGRALLRGPRLLLMDEPLASLDMRLKRQILPFLRRVVTEVNVPVLYVSHDLSEILQLTDHLLILDEGRSVGCGMFWEVVHQSAAIAALHDRGLTNVLSATVVEHDHAHGVTRLSLDARCVLTAPLQDEHAKGTTVQIAIRPMDIALASSQISGISIQNQLAGVVRSCTEHAGRVLVEIDIGYPLLAEVSRRAVQSLSLEPGRPIWCLIKSNAITYLS